MIMKQVNKYNITYFMLKKRLNQISLLQKCDYIGITKLNDIIKNLVM